MLPTAHQARLFLKLVSESALLREAVERADELDLPNWWIVGGVVRDIVWQAVSGCQPACPIQDIDLLFHDTNNKSRDRDRNVEQSLNPILGVPWSIKNQARMHLHNADAPYKSMQEAMFCFPETISSIGIKKGENEHIIFTTCFGFEDLFSMTFRPTPHFHRKQGLERFVSRVRTKRWLEKWPAARMSPW